MKQLELQAAPEPSSEKPTVLSVSQINREIHSLLEGRFPLVWIQGEVSNFKAHSSGHFYFSLKDKKSQINAVMFRGFNSRLKFTPRDGQEVLIRGKVTVYQPRGNYQLFCEVMEPVGAGALQIAFEQLKKKLQGEGLFDREKKRPLPSFPKHIALVTSPTGAALRDMLNVLSRRFKGLQITLAPAIVQGDRAPASLVLALEKVNRLRDVDVVIVGRGGGSMEDLWGFNDEAVARAIAASKVPVISAVGHEVDFTIADFVADLRAPTPSAAAELVVKNASDLFETISASHKRLRYAMGHHLEHSRQQLDSFQKRLQDPRRTLQDLILKCDDLSLRLEKAAFRDLASRHQQLYSFQKRLEDPRRTLQGWILKCSDLSLRLEKGVFRDLEVRRAKIHLIEQRLPSPQETMSALSQQVTFFTHSLKIQMTKRMDHKKMALRRWTQVLDGLSPLRVVERGYSIVQKGEVLVKDSKQIKKGDRIHLRFARGESEAEIV